MKKNVYESPECVVVRLNIEELLQTIKSSGDGGGRPADARQGGFWQDEDEFADDANSNPFGYSYE